MIEACDYKLGGPRASMPPSLQYPPVSQGTSVAIERRVGIIEKHSNVTCLSAGSILINLLLKQPLIPGSPLGLCHLLSSCPEAPAGTQFQLPGLGR